MSWFHGTEDEHYQEAQVLLRDAVNLKQKAFRRVCTLFGRGEDGKRKCLQMKTTVVPKRLQEYRLKAAKLEQELKHVERDQARQIRKVLKEVIPPRYVREALRPPRQPAFSKKRYFS